MAYKFDFGAIVPHWELLVDGMILTTELTVIGAVVGVGLGIMGAWARAAQPIGAVLLEGDRGRITRADGGPAAPIDSQVEWSW